MDPKEIKKQQELLKLQRQLEDIKKLLELSAILKEKKKNAPDAASADALLRDESAEYDAAEWEIILRDLGKK